MMVDINYCPDRGDIVWLDFDPQSGHEQKGRRPAIVISPKDYNAKVGLALCCPITNKVKGYPFEVLLPPDITVKGVIISDQIKSLDWKIRNVEFITKADNKTLKETINKFSTLIKILKNYFLKCHPFQRETIISSEGKNFF
ncbi:MAG: endoribonuclease MazF [Candidatus Kapabacteria bacterium]|nr:endoribonuclease MazF [Candidatus Kapabacteria bacterium]